MSMKLEDFGILNRFGQPTGSWCKDIKPSKVMKLDSFDDFNKYFEQKIAKNLLNKTPNEDTFIKAPKDGGSIPNTF